jgi:hypothetical protein
MNGFKEVLQGLRGCNKSCAVHTPFRRMRYRRSMKDAKKKGPR